MHAFLAKVGAFKNNECKMRATKIMLFNSRSSTLLGMQLDTNN